MATREFGAVETRPRDGSATEQAAEVASTASDAAGQVAQEAGEQLRQVGGAVREQVSELTDEVAAQGRHVVEDAKHQLHQQAQSQTEQLANALRGIGDQISGLLSGQPQDGPVRDYAEQVASKVNDVAQNIQQRGFDGMVSDVERFARRRPGVFLLGAAAAGAVVGRVLRSAKSDSQPNGSASTPTLPSPSGAGTGGLPIAGATPETTVVTPPAPPIMPSVQTTPPGSTPSRGV